MPTFFYLVFFIVSETQFRWFLAASRPSRVKGDQCREDVATATKSNETLMSKRETRGHYDSNDSNKNQTVNELY